MEKKGKEKAVKESVRVESRVCSICQKPGSGDLCTNGRIQFGCSAVHIYHRLCLALWEEEHPSDGCPVCGGGKHSSRIVHSSSKSSSVDFSDHTGGSVFYSLSGSVWRNSSAGSSDEECCFDSGSDIEEEDWESYAEYSREHQD